MAAEKLPAGVTGAQLRAKFNTNADLIDKKIELDPETNKIPEDLLEGVPFDGTKLAKDSAGRLTIRDDWFTETVNGLIAASNGNTNPAPPTNFVTDDDADTANFTLSADESSLSGYEYQINNGTITQVTVKPIPAGNIAIPIGGFKIRVKAITGRNASGWLVNTVPFTVASSNPGNFEDLGAPFIQQALNITGNDYVYPLGSSQQGASVSTEKFLAGQSGIVRFSVDPTKSSGILAVSTGQNIQGRNALLAGINFGLSSPGLGRFQGISLGEGQDDYSNVNFTGTPLGQIVLNGSTIQLQYSFDNGATWNQVDSSVTIPQPNEVIYCKTFFDLEDTVINNIIQTGMV